jgi:hypothetical protein
MASQKLYFTHGTTRYSRDIRSKTSKTPNPASCGSIRRTSEEDTDSWTYPSIAVVCRKAVNRPNQTFALLVAYLSDIHAKLGRAPTTTPVCQAPSILRRPNNRDLQTTVNSVAPRYSHEFTDKSVPEHQ